MTVRSSQGNCPGGRHRNHLEADLTAAIFFEPALELPGEYNFNYYASYEDMKAVSDYLLGQYRSLLAINDPIMEPAGGDYNIYGEQIYHQITAYDGARDKTKRLLSYRFLVELPQEEREHGLCDYGAYYVPAVEEAYLTGLPVWDASFN